MGQQQQEEDKEQRDAACTRIEPVGIFELFWPSLVGRFRLGRLIHEKVKVMARFITIVEESSELLITTGKSNEFHSFYHIYELMR